MRDSLGAALKKYRDLHGLTLRQVEDAIGVSNAYLSQLENDKIRRPSANVLYKLATLYGTEIDVFLLAARIITEQETAKAIKNSLGVLTPDEEKQLLDYLAFLRHKKRRNPLIKGGGK